MKVGTIDPRAHEVFVSDNLLRQVPQATQQAAARRLAAAARAQATNFKCNPAAPKARGLPPRPIPVTPCYRSCFQQAVSQVPTDAYEPEAQSPCQEAPSWSRPLEGRSPRSPEAYSTSLHFTPVRPAAGVHGTSVGAQSSRAPVQQSPSLVRTNSDDRHESRFGVGSPPKSFARGEEPYRTPTRVPSAQRGLNEKRSTGEVRNRSIDMARAYPGAERLARRPPAQRPPVEDECAEYSDRFLPGYEKESLLGRGACAVVWLATANGSRTPVAIKQVAKGTTGKKKSDTEAARKEILFGSYFFHAGGEPKVSPKKCPGIAHIAKLLDYQETKRDIWLVMEFGGTSLTKMAYEIKGEFHRGERLYRVLHLPLLETMKRDLRVLKAVLRQLLSALCLFADHRVVHSDIKPDNILVDQDDSCGVRVRFIDLGSAFSFESPEALSVATPEYMPHEGLEVCSGRNGGAATTGNLSTWPARGRSSIAARLTGTGPVGSSAPKSPPGPRWDVDSLSQKSQPWSFDMWSLGSILLEMSLGTPLWLSYKCRVASDQRVPPVAGLGLFAVPGRDPEKILLRQADAVCHKGLAAVLRNGAGVPLDADGGQGLDLLEQMMSWDPMARISPYDALAHPWLKED